MKVYIVALFLMLYSLESAVDCRVFTDNSPKDYDSRSGLDGTYGFSGLCWFL